MQKYLITKEFRGYVNSDEQTALDPSYLVDGTQNMLIDIGRRSVTSRPGMELVGPDGTLSEGVRGEFSGMVGKNNWRNLKSVSRYLKVLFEEVWYDIKTDLTSSRVQFARYFDDAEKNGLLCFVTGDDKVYNWSGGIAKIASNTAVALTMQGSYTASTISFADTNPDTILDSANGFITAGFESGNVISVSGTASNNRKFTIGSVTAGVITLISDDAVVVEAAGASVLIHNGYPTWKTRGFLSAGTRSVLINGVVYTYTGGETTNTLTGLAALPVITAGTPAFQTVRSNTNAAPLPTGFTNDFCGVQRNQLYLGSETSQSVFASKTDNFASFIYTANRAPGEGIELTLDGFCAGFEASEKDMAIFDSAEGIYSVLFQLSSDNAAEAVNIEKKKTNSGQGLISSNAKVAVKNAVAYITTEPTLDTVGNVENVTSEQTKPISDPVKRDFDTFDFTDASMKHWKRNIVISLPAESKVLLYDLRYQMWQPPQLYSVGLLGIDENGDLLAHSYVSDSTFRLFTSTNDNGLAITKVMRQAYNNYGRPELQKAFNRYYQDGYISANGLITQRILYDFQGTTGELSKTIDGTEDEYLFGTSSLNPLGRNPLGSRPLGGGGLEEVELLQRFRKIFKYVNKNFYEAIIEYADDTLDSQFTIVNHGPNVVIAETESSAITD